MRDKRSLLSFGILLIVAVGTAGFVVNKGLDAIAEVDRMTDQPIYRAERELLAEGGAVDTSARSTALTANWKTYRNEQHGFEVKFPPELNGPVRGDTFLGSYAGHSVNVSIRVVPKQDFSILHADFSKVMSLRGRVINGVSVKEYFNSENMFVYIPLPDGNNQVEFFAEIGFTDAEKNFEALVSSFKFAR